MLKYCKKCFYLFTVLFVINNGVSSELLFSKGWYKTSNKSPKTSLKQVQYIDNDVIPNAKYIHVNARIRIFHRGGVRNIATVDTLRFSLCGIKELRPGAFLNLTDLTTLALSDNDIEHLKYGVFNGLSVVTLFLQRNQIRSIESQAFDNMPNLYRLKINSNKISYWDSNWFKETPRITELYFRRNEIQKIPGKAFKNIKGGHSLNGSYTVDTKIYLSKNNISYIDPNAFDGLKEFSQLYLDRNHLTEIDERVFSQLGQIGVIFLSKNHLTSLPVNMFRSLEADLLTLDLAANHNFTCIPYEIVSNVKLTVLQDIRRLDCKCVLGLLERLVKEQKQNEINTDCEGPENS